MKKIGSTFYKNNYLYGFIKKIKKHVREYLRAKREIEQWKKNGFPNPPPHAVKQEVIKAYAERLSIPIFVETGTYMGDMIYAMRRVFEKIYSIELDQALYLSAIDRFSRSTNIEIFHGDSAEILHSLLSRINEPCLFWLDAHYSGGITAKGTLDTPIIQELQYIFDHPIKNHVILIDDARCFVGDNDYPDIEQLQKYIFQKRPDYKFEIEHDIIRIYV